MSSTSVSADFREIKEKLTSGIYTSRPKVFNGSSKRHKSLVWSLFHEILDDKQQILSVVVCSKCSQLYRYNSKSTGTSHILKHRCLNNDTNLSMDGFVSIKNINILTNDKNKIKEAATNFVSKDLRPFEAVNCVGFIELVKVFIYIGAKYGNLSDSDLRNVIPSPQTISRNVSSKAVSIKTNLHSFIKEITIKRGLAMTTDLWTDSIRRVCYLSLTAHYIEETPSFELKLNDQILCLVPLSIDEKKTSLYLSRVIRFQ